MTWCRKAARAGLLVRHGVIVEVAAHDLSQPFALRRYRLVHALSKRLLDFLELGPHAVGPALPVDQEVACARFAAYEREAEEVEGFRFADAAPLSVGGRQAAELDHAGLVRMQRERKLPKPFAHRIPEAPGVGLVLEADDDVVGISHDNHVARGLA